MSGPDPGSIGLPGDRTVKWQVYYGPDPSPQRSRPGQGRLGPRPPPGGLKPTRAQTVRRTSLAHDQSTVRYGHAMIIGWPPSDCQAAARPLRHDACPGQSLCKLCCDSEAD
eukprot:732568-Hanusia_phi.AAC.1